MTVGELRELIKDLPRDMPVVALDNGGYPDREVYAIIESFSDYPRELSGELDEKFLMISGRARG